MDSILDKSRNSGLFKIGESFSDDPLVDDLCGPEVYRSQYYLEFCRYFFRIQRTDEAYFNANLIMGLSFNIENAKRFHLADPPGVH
jgi:hypothetical protein